MFSDETKFEIINSRSMTVRRNKIMNWYADKNVV
jgi:hypothetical protein